ncbi:DUF2141 domain-containing protein [Sphingobium sp.]|uniref:DUF2141 domain-containing protein n=1 Tax=Sphingobium sp. TaxID=1912891 RepID=UPI003BB4FE9A
MAPVILSATLALLSGVIPPSTPALGKAEAQCRSNESGPAFLIDIVGLKDRSGLLKLEVYPANDRDFLQDDNILIAQGKAFRRVEVPVPSGDPVSLCVRLPGPGRYAVSVLHDRDGNHRFGLSVDGVGFGSNPKLGMGKPRASEAAIVAGASVTREQIVMNYRRGLLSFGPVSARR